MEVVVFKSRGDSSYTYSFPQNSIQCCDKEMGEGHCCISRRLELPLLQELALAARAARPGGRLWARTARAGRLTAGRTRGARPKIVRACSVCFLSMGGSLRRRRRRRTQQSSEPSPVCCWLRLRRSLHWLAPCGCVCCRRLASPPAPSGYVRGSCQIKS